MNSRSLIVAVVIVSVLCLTATAPLFAQGADLYKTKCAACHGPEGQGKVGPALKGTKLSEGDIATFLTKGAAGKKAPHTKPVGGLTEAQAKQVAGYVKSLK